MTAEWETVRIGDLGKVITGKTPSSERPDEFGEAYPFITPSDIDRTSKFAKTERYLSDAGASSLRNALLPSGAVCVVCIGATIGKVVMTDRPSFTNQQINSIVVDRSRFDPSYVFYLCNAIADTFQIFAGGAATPIINKSVFSSIKVRAPQLAIQQKISGLLCSLDDLIANNQRRIALLESIAEEIYREWFVRMRFPRYEGAEFFAGRPVAWQPRRLGQVLQLRYGKALPEGQRLPGPYRVYGSAGVVGTHSEALVTKPSIVVGRKGNVGSIFWASKPFYPIDTVYYVESELPLIYLRFLLAGMNFINSDAAVPGLNREQAYANEVLLPQDSLLSKFEEVVGPLYRQVEALEDQVACLGSTRDALLPRLIAGKLRVDHLDIQFPPSMQPPAEAALAEALA